jgi:hypothetical protein
MTFYSGFSLTGESGFFDAMLDRSDYCVAGFSYGAIKAAKHVLASKTRIDRLQLFSPAFFQSKPERYKKLQLSAYAKTPEAYAEQFILNCFAPHGTQKVGCVAASDAELQELLEYVWTPELLDSIAARGTRIEVYLGGEDRIIDAHKAREFFTPYASVTFIKHANHFLQEQ